MTLSFGFHTAGGGNKNGIGAFISRLNAAGIPVCIKGTDHAGEVFEAQESGKLSTGVDNILAYRVSTAGQKDGNDYDVPRYELAPSEAARLHFNMTVVKWPPELDRSLVYMEPINEPRAKQSDDDSPVWGNLHPVAWLGLFMQEYAQIAKSSGFRVCGPSFNSGEPEPDAYSLEGMLGWLRYCAESDGQAALSLHSYNFQNLSFEENYPWSYGRFQAAIAAADNAGIPRTFDIVLTEFGWQYESVPQWQTAVKVLDEYNKLGARFPQLRGLALWTLQAGWGDQISNQLAAWMAENGDPFVSWILANQLQPATEPQPTAVEFGSTLPGDAPPPIDDSNLLLNPSFEGGWYQAEDRPEFQIPNDWLFSFVEGDNPHSEWDFVPPEVRVLPRDYLPENEQDLFILDGNQTVKIFKGNGAWNATLGQVVYLNGTYRLTVNVFADLVKEYTSGGKIWADDPLQRDGLIRLMVNGDDTAVWQSLTPGQWNTIKWEFTANGQQCVTIDMMASFALANSGMFMDDWTLEKIAATEPPDGGNGETVKYTIKRKLNNDMGQLRPLNGGVVGPKTLTISQRYWDADAGKFVVLDIQTVDLLDGTTNLRFNVDFDEVVEVEAENPSPPPVELLTLPRGSKGVDISAYQPDFWGTVSTNAVDFCYFRLADGMNTSVTSNYHDADGLDVEFWNNVWAMDASGKPWCVYHFLRPSNIEEQAAKVIGAINNTAIMGMLPRTAVFDDGKMLPDVLLDVEDSSLTNEQVKQFRDLVRAAGYTTGIYTGFYVWNAITDGAVNWWGDDFVVVAAYNNENDGTVPAWENGPFPPNGWTHVNMWQYSSRCQDAYGWTGNGLDGNIVGPYPEGTTEPEPPPTDDRVFSTSFMRGEPGIWRVVRRSDGSGEDVWELQKNNDEDIRVKNNVEGEWYQYRADGIYRTRDTSPAPDSQGNDRLYLLSINGVAGGKIAPAEAQVGVTYSYTNELQFKRKSDCQDLDENSKETAVSTFTLIDVIENYTFPTTGFTVDWLYITEQTGEQQLYAMHDGRVLGWVGGGASQDNNVWGGELAELYYDRAIPSEEPPRWCS